MSSAVPSEPSPALRWVGLAAWLALCYSVAGLGSMTLPGPWFAHLVRPPLDPPAWIFGPVWSLLYTLMGIAAWLVWRQAGWRAGRAPLAAFLVQLALNACWSPLFFGLHQIGALVVAAMDFAIAVCVALMWNRHRTAAILFLPYQAWVLFATWLNVGYWWLNRS